MGDQGRTQIFAIIIPLIRLNGLSPSIRYIQLDSFASANPFAAHSGAALERQRSPRAPDPRVLVRE